MAVNYTPRDRLSRIGDFARKALRYKWIIPLFMIIGGGLSVGVAMIRKPTYTTWAVLFYQEKISSSLLQGREAESTRNIGDRYRELLFSHDQLKRVIEDPEVNPFPKETKAEGVDFAIDLLRKAVKFETRGTTAFRIVYTDRVPARAQIVTDKLTQVLRSAEEEMRKGQALATADFAKKQKDQASEELRVTEKKLAEFLAKHPEFAETQPGASSEGAGIRQKVKETGGSSGNPRVIALERQRQRLVARLNARPGETVVTRREPTAEQQAAQAAVGEAEREYQAKQRDLESTQSKFTEKHPSVVKAREEVAAALQRLRRAQAAVPPTINEAVVVAPVSEEDRDALQKQVAQLEAQIAEARSSTGATSGKTSDWVVQLETQHSDLRRAVGEQREHVESLANSVFRAQIEADQQLAEEGTRLTVVDPAFKPLRPVGKGRTFVVAAGLAVAMMLGALLAFGLALIDDRIYRRADLEQLEMLPLLAVIPSDQARKRGKS